MQTRLGLFGPDPYTEDSGNPTITCKVASWGVLGIIPIPAEWWRRLLMGTTAQVELGISPSQIVTTWPIVTQKRTHRKFPSSLWGQGISQASPGTHGDNWLQQFAPLQRYLRTIHVNKNVPDEMQRMLYRPCFVPTPPWEGIQRVLEAQEVWHWVDSLGLRMCCCFASPQEMVMPKSIGWFLKACGWYMQKPYPFTIRFLLASFRSLSEFILYEHLECMKWLSQENQEWTKV